LDLKASELKRKLAQAGCTFQEGKKHTKILLGDRVSQLPRHPSTEIKTGTLQAILKQLGLKGL
jgi:mRNA interferase HicA